MSDYKERLKLMNELFELISTHANTGIMLVISKLSTNDMKKSIELLKALKQSQSIVE